LNPGLSTDDFVHDSAQVLDVPEQWVRGYVVKLIAKDLVWLDKNKTLMTYHAYVYGGMVSVG
jgi:hypothetical protein